MLKILNKQIVFDFVARNKMVNWYSNSLEFSFKSILFIFEDFFA